MLPCMSNGRSTSHCNNKLFKSNHLNQSFICSSLSNEVTKPRQSLPCINSTKFTPFHPSSMHSPQASYADIVKAELNGTCSTRSMLEKYALPHVAIAYCDCHNRKYGVHKLSCNSNKNVSTSVPKSSTILNTFHMLVGKDNDNNKQKSYCECPKKHIGIHQIINHSLTITDSIYLNTERGASQNKKGAFHIYQKKNNYTRSNIKQSNKSRTSMPFGLSKSVNYCGCKNRKFSIHEINCKVKNFNLDMHMSQHIDLYNRYATLSDNFNSNTCSEIKDNNRMDSLQPPKIRKSNCTSKMNVSQKLKPKNDQLKLCFWNCRSIVEKTLDIKDFRLEHDIDIYLLAETWLSESNHGNVITSLKDNTCNFINDPRPYEGRGGGLGCIYKKQLSIIRTIPPFSLTTMQLLELKLKVYSKTYTLVVIYRSEPVANHWYTMSNFFKEFNQVLSHYNNARHEVILTGDFNIHVNKPNDPKAKKLLAILDTFNLIQHIQEPTHNCGNTLDLLITQKNTKLKDFTVSTQLSDHNNIIFTLDVKKPEPIRKLVTNRQIKNIDITSFKNDIKQLFSFNIESSSSPQVLNNLVDTFNSSADVLDKHAPLITRQVTIRDPTPWTTHEIRPEKQKRRKLERKWKKTNLQVDYDNFKSQRNKLSSILKMKKVEHINKFINEHKNDSKRLFNVFKRNTSGPLDTPFPHGKSDIMLAQDFSKYFSDKIDRIRKDLDSDAHDTNTLDSDTFIGQTLNEFQPLSHDQVRKLIMDSNSKSCDLDPIPADLIKQSINEVLPIITEIINMSLKIGVMPDILKHALIKPLLKKLDLELINKNYRPVSNLSFLSKLIEGAVIEQYTNHLERNGIHDLHQSAYKKYHSTETLLTKVKNDIQIKMDKGQVVMLVLLDLSAAFDTIDHSILLNRLEKRYGIRGTALHWFRSYLTNRTQSVIVNGMESDKRLLKYGVPQGSRLGPILFNAYIAPLSEIVRKHGIEDEKFADDEELIMAFSTNSHTDQDDARNLMNLCINDIRTFLKKNKLCNNSDKTEFLIIGTHQQLSKLNFDSIIVGDTTVHKTQHARNLGVMFDEHLSMEQQVKKICKSGYFHLKNIASIRNVMDSKNTEKLVHAFISSTLDYGNSLLYGISQKHINKLQVLQNSAAKLIEKKKKYDHVTETLIKLHWLPIKARIDFKILLLTWKGLNGVAPPYIKSMLEPRNDVRSLRNPTNLLLKVPKVNRITLGGNAFCVVAPSLWNQLPISTRTTHSLDVFKKQLKTFLFKKYYEL